MELDELGVINLDHIRVSPAPIEAETANLLGRAAILPVSIPSGATLKFQRDAGDSSWNVDYIVLQ